MAGEFGRRPVRAPFLHRGRVAMLLWALAALNLFYAGALVLRTYAMPPAGESRLIPDFVAFWAAGNMTLMGEPAAAYDWRAHRSIEVAELGFNFPGLMPWHYPPPLQLMVAPLGALPVWVAMALWVGATLTLYLWTSWRILPDRLTIAAALAAAPTPINLVNGQTGFLLAGLLGLALLDLDRRPFRAGLLLGLLAIKPHLVAAIPVPLLAGARWRVIAGGAVMVATLVLASLAALGPDTWAAFVSSVTETAQVFEGVLGRFDMYASPYGGARSVGLGFLAGMVLHGAMALATLIVLIRAFRSEAIAPAIKAALICFGAAVVTPRIFNYDLHILVIGGLFQVRHALTVGFFRGERTVLAVSILAAFLSMLAAPGVAWALGGLLFWACWAGRVRGETKMGRGLRGAVGSVEQSLPRV